MRSGIREILSQTPQIRKAVLFGSRALGTWKPASDIDLALEGEELDLSVLLTLQARLTELNLPVEVDLIIRNRITNPDLERHIHAYGQEWFSRSME
ncbi:nucleotidyltransferase domain-containing protein [Akkermansia massiliensis]